MSQEYILHLFEACCEEYDNSSPHSLREAHIHHTEISNIMMKAYDLRDKLKREGRLKAHDEWVVKCKSMRDYFCKIWCISII